MTKASDNLFPKLIGVEAAAPGTPASGTSIAYVKADGLWYSKDDAGTETLMSGGAGGGSVATDAIWDAAGDLAVGTGANTAARLAIGTNTHVLTSNGTTATWAAPAGGNPMLAYVANTAGDQSITSATLAALPTNIQVAFTAPASGNVLVRLSATAGATNTNSAYQSWAIREGGSTLIGAVGESIAVRQMDATAEGLLGVSKTFVITGVSGGSHTYIWWAANSASGGTFKANANTPAVMEIWALP
jgi:hypothetical protein